MMEKIFLKMVGGEKIFKFKKNEKIEIINPPEGGGKKNKGHCSILLRKI